MKLYTIMSNPLAKTLVFASFFLAGSLTVQAQTSVTLPGACNTCGVQNSPSSNGTAVITAFTNCSAATTGALTAGTPVNAVTQTLMVTVGTAGTYNISATANGITFSGAGLLAVGNQTIVLTASGTPTTAGTSTFTLNTTPNCSFTRSVATAVTPLPSGIVLSAIRPYFLASVNDTDYLPYTKATSPATLATNVAADGTADPTAINVQGTLTTTGVTILIPYAASGNVTLPAYSQTINIPAAYTEDGIARDIQLSWPSTAFTTGAGSVTATIKSLVGALNAKKLDMQTGIGNDGLGWLLGQFTYPTNSSGAVSPLEVRDIAGIPDRNFNDSYHRFLYLPVKSPSGKVWLNNNLGADYNDVNSPYFNPAQQATNWNDIHAFGSIFQWGRFSDGHELIDWNDPDGYYWKFGKVPNNTYTSTQSTTDTPPNNLWYYNNCCGDWRTPSNDNLWQGVNGANNVCPVGFRVPTINELAAEVTANNITSTQNAWRTVLAFPTAGHRGSTSIVQAIWNSGNINLWSSSIQAGQGTSAFWQIWGPAGPSDPTRYGSIGLDVNQYVGRSQGYAVRCIQN